MEYDPAEARGHAHLSVHETARVDDEPGADDCAQPSRQAAACFTSAKTPAPVPVRNGLVSHVLVQASLDPAVSAIRFIRSIESDGSPVAVNSAVLIRGGVGWVIDPDSAWSERRLDRERLARVGMKVLAVTEEEIRSEPLFGAANEVWRHRDYRVGVGMRMAVLDRLRGGTSTMAELTSGKALGAAAYTAVLALACANVVGSDLRAGLGPQTPVSARDDAFGTRKPRNVSAES
jgi:hypothetical protein